MHSWALGICPRSPGWTGSRQETFTCQRGCWQSLESCRKQTEGPGRVSWGEGGCPPTPLPSLASSLLPEMSLFTARRQDFLLLEKRAFFYRGLEGPEGEKERALASARPSESETHGQRFPTRSPVPSPLLPQLDPWDFHLAKPQTRRNQQNLSLPIAAPRRVSREGPRGPRPHPDLGISN